MKAARTPAELEPFRRAVVARLGLRFDEDRADLLGRVLAERLEASGDASPDAYVARVSGGDAGELRALAERLTVGETYFFRNANDLDAFAEVVLPERTRARAAERRLRILSAGCSSGEEPYTLAMLLRDAPGLDGWDVRVHAFDVNAAAVTRARAARYSAWSLRQTPDERRDRSFRTDGREHVVVEAARNLVAFDERNLADEDAFAPGGWDVVFCRNVLMYLDPEVARRVVARIAAALSPGGFLFLGHAETLRGVSTAFHLRQSHGTFYYAVRGEADGGDDDARDPPPGPPALAAAAPVARAAAPDAGWMRAIQDSAERIAALATPGVPSPATPAPSAPPRGEAPAAPGPEGAVADALELLARDRFADALARLGPATPDDERDADALLLRAVLLLGSGDFAGADAACARILRVDELNAEAHYVHALCRAHAGDPAGAADHDRYALYLDPTFAMPRLHLGLLARRAGDLAAARRELGRALVLLAAEDGSRILLLGGGFGRDGLVALCRAELRACGGRP